MRLKNLILILSLIPLLAGCGGETSAGSEAGGTDQADSLNLSSNAPGAGHNCSLVNEVLEGNEFWIREKNVLIAITADSTTFDEELGPSHRVLEVYDTKTCEQVRREVLPENASPDFPYFIAEIIYNTTSELMGIRGARTIYIYDLANHRLLPELVPQFLTPRLSEDAQSGNILRLEVWENYLIGFAEDRGTFVFDLSEASAPKPILPIAEFAINENEYVPLFGLPSADGMVQLAAPAYDRAYDQFSVNALYSAPQDINTVISAGARNNRYIILRRNEEGRPAVAVDLQNRKLVDLPADVAAQRAQSILQWIRQQQ